MRQRQPCKLNLRRSFQAHGLKEANFPSQDNPIFCMGHSLDVRRRLLSLRFLRQPQRHSPAARQIRQGHFQQQSEYQYQS